MEIFRKNSQRLSAVHYFRKIFILDHFTSIMRITKEINKYF